MNPSPRSLRILSPLLLGISLFAGACNGDGTDPEDIGTADTGTRPDSGPEDTGAGDGGVQDTGSDVDGGPDEDGGRPDAGMVDGGTDAGNQGPGVLFRSFDPDGRPLAGATVRVAGGDHSIGPDGVVFVPGLSGEQVFTVSQPGFTTTSFGYDIPATRVLIDSTLLPLPAPTVIDDAAGGMVSGGESLGQLNPDSVQTAGGADVTGSYEARFLMVDLVDPAQALGAPLPFLGVDSQGMETPLAALAVFEIHLEQNGNELQPKPGQPVQLVVSFPPELAGLVQVDDMVPAWSYDEATGRWMEELDGMVTQTGFGNLVWSGTFDHFSWWLVGIPFSPSCLDTSVSAEGAPLEGALVRAVGTDYGYVGARFSDAGGAACLPLRPDGNVRISAVHENGTAQISPVDVTAGNAPAACGGGDCGQAAVELEAPACVGGRVLDDVGGPFPNALVLLQHENAAGQSVASNTTSDQDGGYCALGPAGASATVLAVSGGLTDSATVSVGTDAAICGQTCADAPDLVLAENFAGCVHGTAIEDRGTMMAPAQAAPGTPIYIYSGATASPSCLPGMDDPQSWGTLVATGAVGQGGQFCITGIPLGSNTIILGNCDDWTSDTCGPNLAGASPTVAAVCGQPDCLPLGEIRYSTVCDGG